MWSHYSDKCDHRILLEELICFIERQFEAAEAAKLSSDQRFILFWSALTLAGKKMLIQHVFSPPKVDQKIVHLKLDIFVTLPPTRS